MSSKSYVIRKKVVKIKPTDIPSTLYERETFPERPSVKPIQTTEVFETLSRPKPKPRAVDDLEPIPQYMNEPPSFDPIDIRVNATTLHRDVYLIKKKIEEDQKIDETEPKEFLKWQEEMRTKDEEERAEIIQKRREDLDHCRRRAMKAKKNNIAARLEAGKELRTEISENLNAIRAEIDQERDTIRYLKTQLTSNAPYAVEKTKRARIESTREMRRQLKQELKEAAERKAIDDQKIRENAAKVRDAVINHTQKHGDAYSSKIEITETNFLAALTDEETQELLQQHSQEKYDQIQSLIDKHRETKEKKMDELVEMLKSAAVAREEKEEQYQKQKNEKRQKEEKETKLKQEEEEQKVLELEKKLEKKRQARIKEAEDMEEHTRQIAARNRYLALNKKTLATKTFQSQQDAKLRSAKERQESNLVNPHKKKVVEKTQKSKELTNVKNLLGI